MKIEAVLFDMDGLMFDTESLSTEAFIDSAKKQDYEMTRNETLQVLGFTEDATYKFWESYFKDSHVDGIKLTDNHYEYIEKILFTTGPEKMPYIEEDTANPLSEYGKSKYEGEQKVLKTYDKSFIIRTSWVFGIANNNFNKQIINWSKVKDTLNIVDDQISVPTYSKDLAEFSWKLIQTGKYGLYHISNEGVASKYEQAKYVLEKIGWKGTLGTAKTKDFNLPAKRSEYSKLSSEKVEKLLGEKIPSWQSGIDRFLLEMKEKGELE